MVTYPHQKIVTVNREMPKGNKETYLAIKWTSLEKALKDLTNNELKCYLYIATNKDNYTFGLSTADIAEKTGASQRRLADAINGLIKKGYLVLNNGAKSHYTFYECPEEIKELPDEIGRDLERKDFIFRGKTVSLTYGELLERCRGNEEKAKLYWE